MTGSQRNRGRQRDPRAHADVLRATRALIAEKGYTSVTIEGIAERSAVAKSTIYRWWPTKAHVALEIVLERYQQPAHPPSEDLRQDFIDFLMVNFTGQAQGALQLLLQIGLDMAANGYAVRDDLAEMAFRARRAQADALFARAIAAGVLPTDVDTDLLMSVFAGVPLYRTIGQGRDPDPADAARVVDLLLSGLLPRRKTADVSEGPDETSVRNVKATS